MTSLIKKRKHKRDKIVQIKVNKKEFIAMKRNAFKYADGNLSMWIRYAAIVLEPMDEHSEE